MTASLFILENLYFIDYFNCFQHSRIVESAIVTCALTCSEKKTFLRFSPSLPATSDVVRSVGVSGRGGEQVGVEIRRSKDCHRSKEEEELCGSAIS